MSLKEREALLAEKLGAVRIQEASDDYLLKGIARIGSQQSSSSWPFFNGRLGWALSAALIISLAGNLLQSLGNDSSGARSDIAIELAQVPVTDRFDAANPQLQITDVAASDSVFRFLCLTKTAVLIDNRHSLGELRGFGEWVVFEIPNNYKVNVSLLPLRDWTAIGEYRDGNITLALEDGHQLSMTGAGLGPSSLKRGGPFPVYGSIEQLRPKLGESENPQSPDDGTQLSQQDNSQVPDSRPASTAETNPYLPVANILAGIDSALDIRTRKYFGAFIDDDECG